jgi:quercetin dioxygenase-like cupin family protein
LHDHQGEEAGLALEGPLEITIEDKKYLHEAGDSFSFKSQLKHRYANPSDLEETVVVWANTPINLRR